MELPKIAKPLSLESHFTRALLVIVGISTVAGISSGYLLSNNSPRGQSVVETGKKASFAAQDTKTFRDFAEGVIKVQPTPKSSEEYTEGTHILEREGASSAALTSSVVDLSQYEGKRVKVFGETQKALKEGWLMDVGKVEEIK